MGPNRVLALCVLVALAACSHATAQISVAPPVVAQGSSITTQSLGGAMPAADLSSSPWDGSASLGGSLSGSPAGLSALSDSPTDMFGRPVTIQAAPLDSQGIPDPLDAGDSQSLSGSSSLSGSGSLSGSLSSALSGSLGLSGSINSADLISGSGSITPIPGARYGTSACTPPGPCGGGGDLETAKIVGQLMPGGKKFVGRGSDRIWSFNADNSKASKSDKNVLELQELERFAAQDPELQLMMIKLKKAKEAMENERNWVEDVKNVITHYRAKIGAVTLALKQQAKDIWTLKAQIIAKRKQDARKLLEQKLARVQNQLQALQNAASNVSGEARNLTQLKGSLSKSIASIEGEISKLKGK